MGMSRDGTAIPPRRGGVVRGLALVRQRRSGGGGQQERSAGSGGRRSRPHGCGDDTRALALSRAPPPTCPPAPSEICPRPRASRPLRRSPMPATSIRSVVGGSLQIRTGARSFDPTPSTGVSRPARPPPLTARLRPASPAPRRPPFRRRRLAAVSLARVGAKARAAQCRRRNQDVGGAGPAKAPRALTTAATPSLAGSDARDAWSMADDGKTRATSPTALAPLRVSVLSAPRRVPRDCCHRHACWDRGVRAQGGARRTRCWWRRSSSIPPPLAHPPRGASSGPFRPGLLEETWRPRQPPRGERGPGARSLATTSGVTGPR
jgi:hypothetical protein